MKILITGASGFLGRALTKSLQEQGHIITGVNSKNCDLTRDCSLEQFNQDQFDQIYHLAAWTQAGDFCLYHPGEQWLVNQKINTNVLSWWQHSQPQAKLIAMGTSCAYDPQYLLSEENYLKGEPIESFIGYGMTKRMLLYGLMSLSRQFKMEYLYLIPSTLYGPYYHTDGRQLHFIFDLIRKILRGTYYGEPVVLWGDGEQKRELIHVQDFIHIMTKLVKTEKNAVINIGEGQEHSIKEFAQMICSHVGYSFDQILFDQSKYVGARSKVLSTQKVKSLLPEFQLRDLEKGLSETIEWFKECHFKAMLSSSGLES